MNIVEKHAYSEINRIREIERDILELRKRLSIKNCSRESIWDSIQNLEDEIYVMTKEMVVSILQLNAE